MFVIIFSSLFIFLSNCAFCFFSLVTFWMEVQQGGRVCLSFSSSKVGALRASGVSCLSIGVVPAGGVVLVAGGVSGVFCGSSLDGSVSFSSKGVLSVSMGSWLFTMAVRTSIISFFEYLRS